MPDGKGKLRGRAKRVKKIRMHPGGSEYTCRSKRKFAGHTAVVVRYYHTAAAGVITLSLIHI